MDEGKIKTHFCEVFQEKLNYFFVGRPAYKKEFSDEAAEWELPICFVFSYHITDAKRIFPFDTGGFERKIFPSFIQMVNRDEFDMTSISDGPSRFIGTFFGSPVNYFKLKVDSEDSFVNKFSLGVFDHEIRALHRLVMKTGKPPDKSTDYKRIDDRRSTIEVQFSDDKLLEKDKLLAVILPEPYYLEPSVTRYFRALGAELISYQTFPHNPDLYYGVIYDKIYSYFKKHQFI